MKFTLNIGKFGELEELYETIQFLEKEYPTLIKLNEFFDKKATHVEDILKIAKLKLVFKVKELFSEDLFKRFYSLNCGSKRATRQEFANSNFIIHDYQLDDIDKSILIGENYLLELNIFNFTRNELILLNKGLDLLQDNLNGDMSEINLLKSKILIDE